MGEKKDVQFIKVKQLISFVSGSLSLITEDDKNVTIGVIVNASQEGQDDMWIKGDDDNFYDLKTATNDIHTKNNLMIHVWNHLCNSSKVIVVTGINFMSSGIINAMVLSDNGLMTEVMTICPTVIDVKNKLMADINDKVYDIKALDDIMISVIEKKI